MPTPVVSRPRADVHNCDVVGTLPAVAGLTVEECGQGAIRTTKITLTDVAVTITDDGATGSGVVQLYDFPLGMICSLGGSAVLTVESDLATDAALVASVGTTATRSANGTLGDSGEGNIVASAAAAISTGAGAVAGKSATTLLYIDGTSTAADAYLHFASGTATNAATLSVSGTILIHWANLGDC